MEAVVAGARRFLSEEEGVTMVEYGLIAALIAVVCILFITNVGLNLNQVFKVICNKLSGAVTGAGGTGTAC